MASTTPLPADSRFRWKCHSPTCKETFAHYWLRHQHLKSMHQERNKSSSINPATSSYAAETTKKANSSTPNEFDYASIEVPSRTAIRDGVKRKTKGHINVNANTPGMIGASSVQYEPLCPLQRYNLSYSGDFIVVLGSKKEGEVEVVVSSQAMCLSSPTWRTICSGNNLTSIQKRASFPDDDADAMLLLIQIAHMKFDVVPPYMDHISLHELAVACYKYDTIMLLRPWARDWIEKFKAEPRGYDNQAISIFWVFGDAEAFVKVANEMVMLGSCERDPKKLRVLAGGKSVALGKTLQIVPKLVENVLKVRENAIASLFQMCDTYILELAQGEKCQICGSLICNALGLGALLQGLHKMGVWPEKPLEQSRNAIKLQDLQQSFLAIKFPQQFFGKRGFGIPRECIGILNRDFAGKVIQICQSASPVMPPHLKELAKRHKMLGLHREIERTPNLSTVEEMHQTTTDSIWTMARTVEKARNDKEVLKRISRPR